MNRIKKLTSILLCLAFVFLNVSRIDAYSHEVFLDVGHGGADSGTMNYDNTEMEKIWNLETALECKNILEENDIKVNISRTDDTYVSLKERSEMANKTNSECFVSIHYNASDNHQGSYGVIIPNKKETSTKLASNVGNQLSNIRDNVKIWDNTTYYSVLRNSNMPSIIVETCFMDNEEDSKYANTTKKRQEIGEYIAYGIMDYLEVDYSSNKDNGDKAIVSPQKTNANISILDRINKIINKNSSNSVREKKDYIKNLLNK